MRESLTRSKKGKTIAKKKAVVSVSKTKKTSTAKATKASSRPKAKATTKKTLSATKKTVKAIKAIKVTAKPTKKATKVTAKPITKATKAVAVKATKAKVVSKKLIVKPRIVKTTSHSASSTPRVLRVRPELVSTLPTEPVQKLHSAAALRSFEQAVKQYHRHHYAEAKELFEGLQRKYPTEVEIIANAQTYIRVCTKKLSEAASQPRNADDFYDQGVFALNIGNFSEAASFFEKALRLRPDEPHLLYTLAATHAQTGSIDQALDYLKRSIQIQPKFRSQALNDSDFSDLKENRQFLELMGLISPFDRFQSRF